MPVTVIALSRIYGALLPNILFEVQCDVMFIALFYVRVTRGIHFNCCCSMSSHGLVSFISLGFCSTSAQYGKTYGSR